MNTPDKKESKGSPKFAIPRHVADIALRYGKTVSKGIQKMDEIINQKVQRG